MNGWPDKALLAIAGSAIAFLLALVVGIIGWAVKLHKETDEQTRKEIWEELLRHRNRLHDIQADISKWKIETLQGHDD